MCSNKGTVLEVAHAKIGGKTQELWQPPQGAAARVFGAWFEVFPPTGEAKLGRAHGCPQVVNCGALALREMMTHVGVFF